MAALNFPSSPANGDVYQGYVYNAAKDVWALVPQMLPNTLDNVADVDIDPAVADNHALLYNATSENWESSAIPASAITSGTFDAARIPDLDDLNGTLDITNGGTGAGTAAAARTNLGLGGTILKVVHQRLGTQSSSSGLAWINSGLTATITPTSTSSKIVVSVTVNVTATGFSYPPHIGLRMSGGNSANTYGSIIYGSYYAHLWIPAVIGEQVVANWTYQDAPNTTSAVTYEIQYGRLFSAHTGTLICGSAQQQTFITLYEVAS